MWKRIKDNLHLAYFNIGEKFIDLIVLYIDKKGYWRYSSNIHKCNVDNSYKIKNLEIAKYYSMIKIHEQLNREINSIGEFLTKLDEAIRIKLISPINENELIPKIEFLIWLLTNNNELNTDKYFIFSDNNRKKYIIGRLKEKVIFKKTVNSSVATTIVIDNKICIFTDKQFIDFNANNKIIIVNLKAINLEY